jgi:exocyst complex component 4
VATQSNYSGAIDDMDPDANVIKLNKDLQAMEEVMTQSLQAPKFKYTYEGLGHLVSSILINSTQYFKRINENGIKKMCRNIFAVQQCLTNITASRESDLDHARQYYELLYLTPDDILGQVAEKGSHFSEHQYTNLLSLANRSQRGAREDELQASLNMLKEILSELENTV